jgi:hypothetical protein
LSYAIRKNNDFYLFFTENAIAIKFIGKELRFLGPDERSQALLLYKALKKRKSGMNKNIWIKSTPGIYIKKVNAFSEFLKEYLKVYNSKLYIMQNKSIQSFSNEVNYNINKQLPLKKEGTYIFAFDDISPFSFFQNLSNINLKDKEITNINLENIKKISDQILMLNYLMDSKNTREDNSI